MYSSPLKWVGGKQTVLPNILPYIGKPNIFVEPFIGSATVSLNVSANKYIINDMNYDLINLYSHLIQNRQKVIQICIPFFDGMTKERYYEVRTRFNSLPGDIVERAALFLVLNKFAFNGVCRYNSKGEFNVPYNNHTRVGFPMKEVDNFTGHFSSNQHELHHGDFANPKLFDGLSEGDVVYFDPPYLASDEFEGNFTKYTKEDFRYEQHTQIVDISKSLRDKGVICLISNHMTKLTEELYKDADEIIVVPKKRMISAKKENRMEINELMAVYGIVQPTGRLF